MSAFVKAVSAELLKVRRSKVVPLTIAAMCLAPLFGALFVVILRDPGLSAGNEGLRAKAALTGFAADWPSFFNLLGQALGVGGVIVFGFVTSWIFGREYTDRTVKDLLCLPASRAAQVMAKFAVTGLWCLLIAVTVCIVGLGTGALLSLDGWDAGLMVTSLERVLVTSLLAIGLCPPVALVASLTRGYLAALGFVILTVVFAQITGALGLGVYIPWAVPALFSGMGAQAGGSPGPVSYLLLSVVCLASLWATVYSWKYSDLRT